MIRVVERPEAPRAFSLQVMAFSADPVIRWLWPEPHEYLHNFPEFLRGFGGGAFEAGTACVADDFVGGTLWLPPGIQPDGDAVERVLNETVTEPARSEAFGILELLGAMHPAEPHWHLAFAGVDPTRQGRGIGAALLQYTLARIDDEHVPSYLESTNPKNLHLYERHGFEVVREIRVGGSPPMYPMRRGKR